MKSPKEIIEEFDGLMTSSDIASEYGFYHGHKGDVELYNFNNIKKFFVNSHIKAIESDIERLKKRIWDNSTRKYDGNDLESACKFHSIGAIDWVEILRYEDGQNHLIWEEISHKQQQLKEWELMK